jgi:hypothetical protein
MFNIQSTKEKNIFDLFYNNAKKTNIKFIDNIDGNVNILKNITTFIIKNITVTIFNNNNLEIILSKENLFADNLNEIKLQLQNMSFVNKDKKQYNVKIADQTFNIAVFDGKINIEKDIVTLTPFKDEMKITLNFTEDSLNKSVSLLSDNSVYKIPEFIVEFYDDVDLTTPRPFHKGYAILSTVPSISPSVGDIDTTGDYYTYKIGKGTKTRKMYVKVTSDIVFTATVYFILKIEGGTWQTYTLSATVDPLVYTCNFDLEETTGDKIIICDVLVDTIVVSYIPIKFSISDDAGVSTDDSLLFNIFSTNNI